MLLKLVTKTRNGEQETGNERSAVLFIKIQNGGREKGRRGLETSYEHALVILGCLNGNVLIRTASKSVKFPIKEGFINLLTKQYIRKDRLGCLWWNRNARIT